MKRALALAAGVAAAVPLAGHLKWTRTTSAITRTIETGMHPALDAFTRDRVSTLPDPVARYFRRALPEGQRYIRRARFEQRGEFFTNGTWRPFTATQVFSGGPAAFVWDARISMAPFTPVYVRDSYVNGVGAMEARVLALYAVVNQRGTPELTEGALMRYLGEAAWLPTTLLPGRSVEWSAIDARSARATLTEHGISVSLDFRFTDEGDVAEIYSANRFREVNGRYIRTPWLVRALGHEQHHGIRIMSPAEVSWMLPEGPLPYWRGRIIRAYYE